MTAPRMAAIYARISVDRTGAGEGVERQLQDARALAESRDLVVVEEYVDNDKSAYSGRTRPGWNRMIDALSEGEVVHVVAWANDRLYRTVRDQLALIQAVRLSGGTIFTCKDGEVDPSSAEGRMRMTILSSVAEFESARKAERVTRASEARAAKGKPHGRVPYGWRSVGVSEWSIDPDQASVIREAADRVLAGEPVGQIVADWNGRSVPTPTRSRLNRLRTELEERQPDSDDDSEDVLRLRGDVERAERVVTDRWSHQTLRKLLRRDANVGQRAHHGQVVASATWPPILDLETHDAVIAALKGPGQNRPKGYLLTGVARCSNDGGRMVGHKTKVRGYECTVCGRRIAADKLDDLVVDRVLRALSRPRAIERLANARADDKSADALKDFARADKRVADVAKMFGAGQLDAKEFDAARASAREQREKAERKVKRYRATRSIADVIGQPGSIVALWESKPLVWHRDLIASVVDHVEVGPSTKPTWEPERVTIRVRL